MTVKYAVHYDGKDYPSTGNPFYDTISTCTAEWKLATQFVPILFGIENVFPQTR